MRYKNSKLGIVWSIVIPIFFLLLYALIFSQFFKLKLPESIAAESFMVIGLYFFLGLITFNYFAECLNKSASLLKDNVTYIKKIVFPLFIIPLSSCLSLLVIFLINLIIWLIFYSIFYKLPTLVMLLQLIILLLPFMLLVYALALIISALGIVTRDVIHLVSIVLTLVFFMTPIFYSSSIIPESVSFIYHLNPLVFLIENMRDVFFNNKHIDFFGFSIFLLFSILIAIVSTKYFNKFSKMVSNFA